MLDDAEYLRDGYVCPRRCPDSRTARIKNNQTKKVIGSALIAGSLFDGKGL